ncbi:hypothetical protein BaRGS_00001501, partial [Batillaria attramentaria]
MIHLEIVGSNPSPRGPLSRIGSFHLDKPSRIDSPSMYPTSRGSARLIRIPHERLSSRPSSAEDRKRAYIGPPEHRKFRPIVGAIFGLDAPCLCSGQRQANALEDSVVRNKAPTNGVRDGSGGGRRTQDRDEEVTVMCPEFEPRPPAPGFRGLESAALCEQWLGLHKLPYPHPPAMGYGVPLPPLAKGVRRGVGGPHMSSASAHWPFYGQSSASTFVHGASTTHDDVLVIRGRGRWVIRCISLPMNKTDTLIVDEGADNEFDCCVNDPYPWPSCMIDSTFSSPA